MSNITALFDATLGKEVLDWFEAIGAAKQAVIKNPGPSVYLWVLQQLKLPAAACLAIENTQWAKCRKKRRHSNYCHTKLLQ